MKYLKVLFLSTSFLVTTLADAKLSYPLETISKPECRFQDYNLLGDDCKMPFPVLKTSDYSKYKDSYNLYRRVYAVLWGATYNYGWDVGNGGHGGVDIVSSKGTPVYAMADGKVVLASSIPGRGNTVKIEHMINGRRIYSNYSHLSKIDVSIGDKVEAKTKIGEVGSTGNAFGNHLHFQIDLSVSGKGPWYRSNCREKKYENIVNSNICFNQLNINTIDPLLFLETGGDIVKENSILKPEIKAISQSGLLSRKDILKKEIEEFLNKYKIDVNMTPFGGSIELGKFGTFRVTVNEKKTNKLFNGSLPGSMNFKFDEKRFDVFPRGIFQIDNGARDLKVTPKVEGKMSLDIYIGEIFFKRVTFGAINGKKQVTPVFGVLLANKQSVISSISKAILYFKDKHSSNILGFKFDGKFKLKSSDKSIKFCLKRGGSLEEIRYLYNSNCDERFFSDELEFSYKDTVSGVLVFDYKVTNIGPNILELEYNSKPFLVRNLLGIKPYGLDASHPYYLDIINISKLGLASGLSKGYFLQDKELSTLDGINMLTALLDYKISKCTSKDCKSAYLERYYNLSKYKPDKYTYFTRGEYLKLIGDTLIVQKYNGNDFVLFRDLSKDLQEHSKNILKGKTWKDRFGKTRYFQPDKKITRGEGAFLLNSVLD